MKRAAIAISLCSLLFLAAPSATASASMAIDFVGTSWSDNQKTIVNAAAAEWTSLLDVYQPLTLHLQLADLPGTALGLTSAISYYLDVPYSVPAAATITLDTGSWISWNLASALTGYYDALTILAHEMGHALGMAYGLPSYNDHIVTESDTACFVDGSIRYRLYSTSSANFLSHLYDSTDLLYPYLNKGLRLDPSDTDIAILSSAYGYAIVPLPTALLLFAPCLAAFMAIRRKISG